MTEISKGLHFLDLDVGPGHFFSPAHVLDSLRESPLAEHPPGRPFERDLSSYGKTISKVVQRRTDHTNSGTWTRINGEALPFGHHLALSLLQPCLPQRPPKGTSGILLYALLIDDDDCPIGRKIELIRPLEILCQILQFVVRSDGVKALLPSTHVSVYWRRAALSDPSLWTTIYLSQTSPPLLDMILARAGNQLFTIYADHRDFDRFAKLWILVPRFEEFHYSVELEDLVPFLASLGPAPNLKVLCLRPESFLEVFDEEMSRYTIPTIFLGRLPSLRHLSLSKTVVWPTGLFRGLTSFECGTIDHFPVFPDHVLDAIRGSPLIESLRVVGCAPPIQGPDTPLIPLSSLRKCTLIGEGVASLIEFIAVPATALVTLGKPYAFDWTILPEFSKHSVAPGLRTLGEISTVSFSINDDAARLQARNNHGGALDVVVDRLKDLSRDPPTFTLFMRRCFEHWNACPGLKSTKEFTLSMDRSRVWSAEETERIVPNLIRLISNLPGIEEARLYGVPEAELGAIVGLLTRTQPSQLQCPNLRRLDIVSPPTHSPQSLLMALSILLETRKEAGVPFQSVRVKIRCETPLSVAVHCAFLAVWESLVGEGAVRLEYERTKVGRRRTPQEGSGDGGEGGGEKDRAASVGDPEDGAGWDGWPEKWPKTLRELPRGDPEELADLVNSAQVLYMV